MPIEFKNIDQQQSQDASSLDVKRTSMRPAATDPCTGVSKSVPLHGAPDGLIRAILDSSPDMISVYILQSGALLVCNAASKATLSEHDNLAALFALDPNSLTEALKSIQHGGVWKGALLRVIT